ncbi:MAG: hypothetical protein ACETVR_00390 [Candidatus Bathyarchaeia archaeon]
MPAKKGDYEKIFNELLDTNIRWSNLRLEDLVQLAVIFDNPEILVKKLGISAEMHKEESKRRLGDIILELADSWEGPLAKALRKFVGS